MVGHLETLGLGLCRGFLQLQKSIGCSVKYSFSIHCLIPCTMFRRKLDHEKYIFKWVVLELQEQLAKRHDPETSIHILNTTLCCQSSQEFF